MTKPPSAELARARRRLAELEKQARDGDLKKAELTFTRTLVKELEKRCKDASAGATALFPAERQRQIALSFVLREEAQKKSRKPR